MFHKNFTKVVITMSEGWEAGKLGGWNAEGWDTDEHRWSQIKTVILKPKKLSEQI
jgi:hypothetical protein